LSQESNINFIFNGKELKAKHGEPIIQAALDAGIHIPHFCYHKNLSVVGQCRACLVEITDAGNGKPIPKLQPSCATFPSEGMVVSSETPKVDEAQKGVFEFLLKNHPLDCPVCDQGGECPLQDQTMSYANAISRTQELRRIFPKKEISPFIKPEMNRCVHCTRCIRFTSEIDGGEEFGWAFRGDKTEVGIYEDLPLSSIVSGNVIDICPVGALTDNKYRFTSRVWEMEHIDTSCTLCSIGCKQRVWSQEGILKRVTASENPEVNDTWICDVARYGWSGAHAENRISKPMIRVDDILKEVNWDEAVEYIADKYISLKQINGGNSFAGLGGSYSSNEAAYQFQKFFRTVLESEQIDCRIHPRDFSQTVAQTSVFGHTGGFATLSDLSNSSQIVLFGSDPFLENPILALQIRKAHSKGAYIDSINPRKIDLRLNSRMSHFVPSIGQEINFIKAIQKIVSRKLFPDGVSNFSNGNNPKGFDGLDEFLKRISAENTDGTEMEISLLEEIATRLITNKDNLTFVIGPFIQSFSLNSEILNLAKILDCNFFYASVPPNLQGAFDMMISSSAKGIHKENVEVKSSEEVFDSILAGEISSLYLMDCDPVSEHPNGKLVREALESPCFVVVHATHVNATVPFADVVLPSLTSYEENGSYTNIERRVLRNRRAIKPVNGLFGKEAWKVFSEIAKAMEIPMKTNSIEKIQIDISKSLDDYEFVYTGSKQDGTWLSQEKEGQFIVPEISNPNQMDEQNLKLILTPNLSLSGVYVSSSFHLWDMPGACIRMCEADGQILGILNGDEIEFKIGEKILKLPVEIDQSIPSGLVFAPEGFLKIYNNSLLNIGEFSLLLEEKKENL
jgi:NADH-quinone oxidoreductase subunit G